MKRTSTQTRRVKGTDTVLYAIGALAVSLFFLVIGVFVSTQTRVRQSIQSSSNSLATISAPIDRQVSGTRQDWPTYTAAAKGISFRYPPGWIVEDLYPTDQSGQVDLFSFDIHSPGADGWWLRSENAKVSFYWVGSESNWSSMDEIRSWTSAGIFDVDNPDTQMQSVIIAGVDGYFVPDTEEPSEGNGSGTYYIPYEGRVLAITFRPLNTVQMDIVREIVSTIGFTK